MSVADVAERTSRNVENDDGGSLFDETASWYARLRDRSEGIIIDTLNSNVREALRPYRNMYVTQSVTCTVGTCTDDFFFQQPVGHSKRPFRCRLQRHRPVPHSRN